MSDDLTARDVIACALSPRLDKAREFNGTADRVLAALAAAGYTIVTTEDWEWGVRKADGTEWWPERGEEFARRVGVYPGEQVIRRRRGPVEVVPDAR